VYVSVVRSPLGGGFRGRDRPSGSESPSFAGFPLGGYGPSP